MYVLSFLYYMIWHVIIFGYIIKLHIIITKCHTLYVGKMGVATECIKPIGRGSSVLKMRACN